MNQIQASVPIETWISATWEEFIQLTSDPAYENVKAYYYNGKMRLESMAALGNPHSRDHYIVIVAIALFTSLKGIDIDGHDNCTYRKAGNLEIQPDTSFYVGANAEAISWETKIIDLDLNPPPDLIIEVADSSSDDKGDKRLIYEALGIREYWIIDVQNVEVLAFTIADNGSRRIYQSQVLTGLEISLLEEAFRRSREMNHGKVSAWLMNQFQVSEPER